MAGHVHALRRLTWTKADRLLRFRYLCATCCEAFERASGRGRRRVD